MLLRSRALPPLPAVADLDEQPVIFTAEEYGNKIVTRGAVLRKSQLRALQERRQRLDEQEQSRGDGAVGLQSHILRRLYREVVRDNKPLPDVQDVDGSSDQPR